MQLQEDISHIGIDGGFVVDELRVCDLKSGVKRDVTLPVTFYDKAEKDDPI